MSKIVKVVALGCLWLLAGQTPTIAQGWPSWAKKPLGAPMRAPPAAGGVPGTLDPIWTNNVRGPGWWRLADGGPRPDIAPKTPPTVAFAHDFPANSIVIDTGARRLYYVLDGKRAYEYTISVGREGFSWTGTEKISRKQAWPDWIRRPRCGSAIGACQ